MYCWKKLIFDMSKSSFVEDDNADAMVGAGGECYTKTLAVVTAATNYPALLTAFKLFDVSFSNISK